MANRILVKSQIHLHVSQCHTVQPEMIYSIQVFVVNLLATMQSLSSVQVDFGSACLFIIYL